MDSGHGYAYKTFLTASGSLVVPAVVQDVGPPLPFIWKDGVRTALSMPESAELGYAFGGSSNGEDFAIAGFYATDTAYACYWDSTGYHTLDKGRAYDACAANGKVYVGGILTASNKAVYWVDGTRVDVDTTGFRSEIKALTVVDGTVYAIGSYQSTNADPMVPCYWVGTERKALSGVVGSTYIYDIAVAAGTVYVAGSIYSGGNRNAAYWADGTRVPLDGSNKSTCKSIDVVDGTIYTSGYRYGELNVWTGVDSTITVHDDGSKATVNGNGSHHRPSSATDY